MLDLLDLAYQEYWSLDEAIWLHRYSLSSIMRAQPSTGHGERQRLGVPCSVPLGLCSSRQTSTPKAVLVTRKCFALLSDACASAHRTILGSDRAYDSMRQCDRARYAAELAAAMHAATTTPLPLLRANAARLQLALDTAAARSAFDAARHLEDPAWPARCSPTAR